MHMQTLNMVSAFFFSARDAPAYLSTPESGEVIVTVLWDSRVALVLTSVITWVTLFGLFEVRFLDVCSRGRMTHPKDLFVASAVAVGHSGDTDARAPTHPPTHPPTHKYICAVVDTSLSLLQPPHHF